MAENGSSDTSNSLFSMNSLLTLVTVLGGIVLVSHKLSSDRPKRTNPEGTRPLGTQNIESRLWEDPFAAWEKLEETERETRTTNGLDVLRKLLPSDLVGTNSAKQLILGVMVSGQPYAEDQESRIRIRYAVGAALGTGGYKPGASDHIGLAAAIWPSSEQLSAWKANCNATLGITTTISDITSNSCLASDQGLRLRVPFEEYEKREYFPKNEYSNSSGSQQYDRILLLWLDEEYFDDDPATRLALFLNQIAPSGPLAQKKLDRVIIGPRSSDTLRTLVSSSGACTSSTNLWGQVVSTLRSVQLILATPTAMDEVLVPSHGLSATDFINPRQALAKIFKDRCLFNSVHSFVCTDKQLAEAAVEELKLRGVDPAERPGDHVVLISEWDSFHARMSGLALAAQISIAQHNSSNVFDFTEQVLAGTNLWPKDLHRFVYLQGLDGEAAETEESYAPKSQKDDGGAEGTTSIEDLAKELAKLKPEVNKAEGAAQFDYLNRLGEVLTTLDKNLWRRGRGRVAAVGIVGSDVYDTLLILQALRPRLPDAIFFTSDLDARLWDPEELKWSRNLVVLSGYGLELDQELQTGVAPFRDSAQCAEFLSTLDAVRDGRIRTVDAVSPRRFEIARGGPVDLTTKDEIWPHPLTRIPPDSLLKPLAVAIGIFTVAALIVWKPLRLLAFPSREYCCEPLTVAAEDFGTTEEVGTVFGNLETRRNDGLAHWLLGNDVSLKEGDGKKESKDSIKRLLNALIKRCNNLIFADRASLPLPDADTLKTTLLLNTEERRALSDTLNKVNEKKRLSADDVCANRQVINYILDHLRGQPAGQGGAAYTAQQISLLRYHSRKWRPRLFWFTAILLGGGLLLGIFLSWRDTYIALSGEPFNFRGTSAWPAELIRFTVFGLSLLVIIKTQRRLSQSILEITRSYRLDLDMRSPDAKPWRFWAPEPPLTDAEVDANTLWSEYRRTRHWKGRLLRVLACIAIYLCFAASLSKLTGAPFSPIRGEVLRYLDPKLLVCSVLAVLFVTFWMIDAAQSCAWFIRRLSLAPTRYPKETVEHFKDQRAVEDEELVEEWIDLQLIADLTEPVGQLVYWPFVGVLLMLVARNSWLDHWTWHWPLLVIFALNMVLAATSSIILQRAARKAQEIGVQRLKEKANQKQRSAAATILEHESNQANQLLEEINGLRRGAFAPLSQNPLVGALLVNSSGLVLLEVLPLLFSK